MSRITIPEKKLDFICCTNIFSDSSFAKNILTDRAQQCTQKLQATGTGMTDWILLLRRAWSPGAPCGANRFTNNNEKSQENLDFHRFGTRHRGREIFPEKEKPDISSDFQKL